MGLFDWFNTNITKKTYEKLSDKAYDPYIKDDDIDQLSDDERVFYVLYLYNMEIQNGGLAQFFVNSTKIYAHLISDYLFKLGANEHKELYDGFIKKNKIDVYDLRHFEIRELSDYQDIIKMYDFDSFDNAYKDNLLDYLEAVIKEKNI